ncbi:putative non-specific serine/threonine protein kinase [Helianthus annuus]|nr:putative non-specific serine/threonine protein kinase [Helianthus annuus]
MGDNICHKPFIRRVFFVVSLVLVFVWFKTTTATSLSHQASNYKCIDKERHALLHFKSYIHQDPDGLLSTWTPKEVANDCCNWSGVTCNDKTGHVTILDLSVGLLRGKISPSLLNLSYLNHLDLYGNFFNGTIPMFIGSMTRLKYLDLSNNNFTGTVPMFIGSMT